MAGKILTIAQQKGGSGKTTLAAHLAVEAVRNGCRVALVDTDPQGSLGRWFLLRDATLGTEGLTLSTSSAWGVGYEVGKLAGDHDLVLIDTPPKVDSDLRPALRAADMVLVPVAASEMDLWATEGLLDLARREERAPRAVLNRMRKGVRHEAALVDHVAQAGLDPLQSRLGHRVAYAETMGQGQVVSDVARHRAARQEIAALWAEVAALAGL